MNETSYLDGIKFIIYSDVFRTIEKLPGQNTQSYIGNIVNTTNDDIFNGYDKIFVKKISHVYSTESNEKTLSPFYNENDIRSALNESRIYEKMIDFTNRFSPLSEFELFTSHTFTYYGCKVDVIDESTGATEVYLFFEPLDDGYEKLSKEMIIPTEIQIDMIKLLQLLHEQGIYHSDILFEDGISHNLLVKTETNRENQKVVTHFILFDFGDSCYSTNDNEFGRFCTVPSEHSVHRRYPCELQPSLSDAKRSCLQQKDFEHLISLGVDRELVTRLQTHRQSELQTLQDTFQSMVSTAQPEEYQPILEALKNQHIVSRFIRMMDSFQKKFTTTTTNAETTQQHGGGSDRLDSLFSSVCETSSLSNLDGLLSCLSAFDLFGKMESTDFNIFLYKVFVSLVTITLNIRTAALPDIEITNILTFLIDLFNEMVIRLEICDLREIVTHHYHVLTTTLQQHSQVISLTDGDDGEPPKSSYLFSFLQSKLFPEGVMTTDTIELTPATSTAQHVILDDVVYSANQLSTYALALYAKNPALSLVCIVYGINFDNLVKKFTDERFIQVDNEVENTLSFRRGSFAVTIYYKVLLPTFYDISTLSDITPDSSEYNMLFQVELEKPDAHNNTLAITTYKIPDGSSIHPILIRFFASDAHVTDGTNPFYKFTQIDEYTTYVNTQLNYNAFAKRLQRETQQQQQAGKRCRSKRIKHTS